MFKLLDVHSVLVSHDEDNGKHETSADDSQYDPDTHDQQYSACDSFTGDIASL